MANKRGGLSKREFAAKQAGGKLDYKTGSISISKPKTSTPTKTQSGTSALSSIKALNEKYSGKPANSWSPGDVALLRSYQSNQDLGNQAVAYQNTQKVNIAQTEKDNAVAEKKKNRKTAAQSLSPTQENLTKMQSDRASGGKISQGTVTTPKPTNAFSNLMSSIGRMWAGNGVGMASKNAFLSDQERQANINAGLGIGTAEASGPSALENYFEKSATPDQPTGYGPEGETYYNNFDPAVSGGMTYRSDFATPGTDFSRPGSEAAYIRGESPISYGAGKRAEAEAYGSKQQPEQNRKTPRKIVYDQTPKFTPPASPQESITPQFTSIVPDYTPVSTGQPGTQRRLLGNGMLSNGVASNGKLDQNLDGLSYGSAPSDEDSLLRELLGINTAQAADLPQQMAFGNKTTPMSSFQSGFESGGLTLDPGYSMPQVLQRGMQQETQGTNNDYAPRQMAQNPGGSQGGGVSQQYSQGATGGNTMEGYYNKQMKIQNKAFSAQEKAQKKALEELLKSIKNQYETQQTEGLNTLNKSKQEDLLKLSGLFNFANQDPNSEQRMQYEQRANNDYSNQQSDFLAKLAASMQGDISSAKQGYQKEISSLASQRNDARSRIEELIFKAQQDELERNSKAQKSGGSQSAGSVVYIGNDEQGNPVYRNTKTGAMETYPGVRKPAGNPVATGDWQIDPDDGQMKQVYLQDGQPGFIY